MIGSLLKSILNFTNKLILNPNLATFLGIFN